MLLHTGPAISVIDADLHLRGAVTVADAAELHQEALRLARQGADVTARCAALERLDAAALQVLLALARDLAADGKGLRLADLPDPVAGAIRLAGLSDHLLAPAGGARA